MKHPRPEPRRFTFPHMDDLIESAIEQCGEEMVVKALEEMRRGEEAQKVLAQKRQDRLAQSVQLLARAKVEGLGQFRARIDAQAYHYWGGREGYDCWQDDQFLNEFQRDNPNTRVPVPQGNSPPTIVVDRKLKPRRTYKFDGARFK